MAGVNKVILMGNTGNEPELTYTQGGLAICRFSVATSKKLKNGRDKTTWHKCVSFGKTGEAIRKYIGKGCGIYIDGELSYGQYEKDGITRYTTEIIVNEFSFTPASKRPGEQSGSGSYNNNSGGGYDNYHDKGNKQQFETPNEMNDYFSKPPKDDDIPF